MEILLINFNYQKMTFSARLSFKIYMVGADKKWI